MVEQHNPSEDRIRPSTVLGGKKKKWEKHNVFGYDGAIVDGEGEDGVIIAITDSSGEKPTLYRGLEGHLEGDSKGYVPHGRAGAKAVIVGFRNPEESDHLVRVNAGGSEGWVEPWNFVPEKANIREPLPAKAIREAGGWGYTFGFMGLPSKPTYNALVTRITDTYINGTPWMGKMGFRAKAAVRRDGGTDTFMDFFVQNDVPTEAVAPIIAELNKSGLVRIEGSPCSPVVGGIIEQTRHRFNGKSLY